MSGFSVPTEEMQEAAQAFASASRDCQVILKRLDLATEKLEKSWSGVTQEAFYTYFSDWREHMANFAVLLASISSEMNAISERYQSADTLELDS